MLLEYDFTPYPINDVGMIYTAAQHGFDISVNFNLKSHFVDGFG
jgi:hypothetical protein